MHLFYGKAILVTRVFILLMIIHVSGNITQKSEVKVLHANKTKILPWGPQKWNTPCPIHYPYFNETRFCKSVGRQRAIVTVDEPISKVNTEGISQETVQCVFLPWRRHDDPSKVGVFVMSSATKFHASRVTNPNRVIGQVCFLSDGSSHTYAIYFLPFSFSIDLGSGSYHGYFLGSNSTSPILPDFVTFNDAKLEHFESYSPFDERLPMELVASYEEIALMIANANYSNYLTWVSFITNTTIQSPRMQEIPYSFVVSGPNTSVVVEAIPEHAQVIQVVVFAYAAGIEGIDVVFNDIGDIPASSFTCFQTSGRDYRGEQMKPAEVNITKGHTGQLLIAFQTPTHIACNSTHKGTFTIHPKGMHPTIIDVKIVISCQPNELDYNSDLWRLERMQWLNSAVGIEPSLMTRPYSQLRLQSGNILHCRGRSVTVGTNGLINAIKSNGRSVLDTQMEFVVSQKTSKGDVHTVQWVTSTPSVILGPGNTIAWWSLDSVSNDKVLNMHLDGSMSYDGYLNIGVTIIPSSVVTISASLSIPILSAIARFAIGAGFGDNGDFFPWERVSDLNWQWGNRKNSKFGWRMWVGDVDAGLFIKLKGSDKSWNRAEGGLDPSWSNNGLGGINVTIGKSSRSKTVNINAYTGFRLIKANQPITFNFSFVITPVKGDYQHTLEGKTEHYKNTRHFHTRYAAWNPPDPAYLKTLGVTTIVIHQSNRLNPYINWPFHPDITPKLKKYIEDANNVGAKVKIYFTTGEITNHVIELWALVGLNGEIILRNLTDNPPPPREMLQQSQKMEQSQKMKQPQEMDQSQGRLKIQGMGHKLVGNEWLEEHMVRNFMGSWFTQNPDSEDASINDGTTSRWMNYYVRGQQWLYTQLGLSGLYYDGFKPERFVQQRIRRMTVSTPRETWFDVHGVAFVYAELLPFVDSMWTAEGIDFTKGPGYWLATISALPFGVFGEMLGGDKKPPIPGSHCGENCANKWRGMLFGMTNRAGWNGNDPNDNVNLWKLWDTFDIVKANMYGWWNNSTPIMTNRNDILATSYVRPGISTLIAIASWNETDIEITLQIEWNKLGLESENCEMIAPFIPSFNRANTTVRFPVDKPLLVPSYQGWLLKIQPKQIIE